MINAFRRFVILRGHPKEIRSDCGRDFTRADEALSACVDEFSEQMVNGFCAQKGLNGSSTANLGKPYGGRGRGWGLLERIVRSVRQILKALSKEQVVNDKVLSTVMTKQ